MLAQKISFRLQSVDDIKILADSCGFLDITELHYLAEKFVKLNPKEAIVTTYDKEPFLIKSLDFYPKQYLPKFSLQNLEIPSKSEAKSTDDEAQFLSLLELEPFLNVFDRRARLNWNHLKYSKIVDELLSKGVIEKNSCKTR